MITEDMCSPTTFVQSMQLQSLAPGRYRGLGPSAPNAHIFGGYLIAQALVAAYGEEAPAQQCHSLHSHFLVAGDARLPIDYSVSVAKGGTQFSVRRVVANQGDRQLFNMTASFHRPEKGFEHQAAIAPAAVDPEMLVSEAVRLEAARGALAPGDPELAYIPAWIDSRWSMPQYDVNFPRGKAECDIWTRLESPLTMDLILNQAALSYVSDLAMLAAPLNPHGRTWAKLDGRRASLDHAVWFHRSVFMNDWHHYMIDSPIAHGGRGYARGQIFDRQGQLVASTAQEALIRPGFEPVGL